MRKPKHLSKQSCSSRRWPIAVPPPCGSPLTARLVEYLGGVGDDVSSTSMSVPVIERVNVQLASMRTRRRQIASM